MSTTTVFTTQELRPGMPLSLAIVNPDYKIVKAPKKDATFQEFYPFYLGQHQNKTCRRMHLAGTTIALVLLLRILCSLLGLLQPMSPVQVIKNFAFAVVQAYAWSWTGHFAFESNTPATLSAPVYSFLGDMRMWSEVVTLQRRP